MTNKNITLTDDNKKLKETKATYLEKQLKDKSNYEAFKRLTEK